MALPPWIRGGAPAPAPKPKARRASPIAKMGGFVFLGGSSGGGGGGIPLRSGVLGLTKAEEQEQKRRKTLLGG